MTYPALTTARLTLGTPGLADFEHRAAHEGGPLTRGQAWRFLASEVGPRPLKGRGAVPADQRGARVGEGGICHAKGCPEREPGRSLPPEAGRRRLAVEAARAVMARARLGGRICGRPGIGPTDVVTGYDLRGLA